MISAESVSRHHVGYILACLLAVFTYFFALDSQHIPKNGDEYVYEHIVRLTAESGKLLPLQSELDHMRNTKPPLLMWQGIASTSGGKDWTLWALRYPSVIYTLLTAALLFMLGRKLTGNSGTGFIAALTWLAFFSTYRFGRPFLTNPPEVLWLFLPFFVLLYWRQAFASRFVIPLLLGIAIGIGFLYKSFALGLPVTLALAGWYLHQRDYRLTECLKQDAIKVAIAITVAVGIFALWFVFDPDPQAVWQEFIVGENAGKFDPHGPGYLAQLLWGGSSLWSYTLAFLTNPGMMTFPVVALFVVLFRRRRELSRDEKLLLILVAAFFVSFALPSQRSGRYLLDAMPAVALLCALNWPRIGRGAFIASLLLMALVLAGVGYLAFLLQAESPGMYTPWFWLLIAGTVALLMVTFVLTPLTRMGATVSALLVLLCLSGFTHPFDGALGNLSDEAKRFASGKKVWAPCNFRAMYEGHRFIMPGAEVHGYHDDLKLTASELAARYPLFVLRVPMGSESRRGDCEECSVIGERLDIRGRQNSAELKEMFLEGKVFEHLFVREVLLKSPEGDKTVPSLTLAQECR